jgi:hypothetical protein
MDRWQGKQLETRPVEWPWAGKRELVTISRWHWWYFDLLCRINELTSEELHRDISARYPLAITESMHWSITHYLDLRWDCYRIDRDKLANDNFAWRALRDKLRQGRIREVLTSWSPSAQEAYRRTRPRPLRFPTVRTSPFKFIARPKEWRPITLRLQRALQKRSST